MKVINIAKGLQLKKVENKIVLMLDKNTIHSVQDTYLNEMSMATSAQKIKQVITKKYFSEHYKSELIFNGMLVILRLWCRDETGYEYKRSETMLCDNNRFVTL